MSENVEASLRGFEAFSHGDWDACLAEIDPEIEWHLTFQLPDLPPEKTVFRGHDEVKTLWDAFRGAWDELTLELEQVLYDRDDMVIAKVRFRGRGGSSGAEVDRVLFYVQELREARLLRLRPFQSEAEAFAAADVERD